MAIIQISKIQQRSGDLVDLPQLDEAEFGFASDAKRLYIGKEDPPENVEVLTSYSNIAFSQLEGSIGNLDIDPNTIDNGQVLAFDGDNWVNKGGDAGGLLTLGTAGNVKINGGAIGYTLTTDGTGNLSWTPKGSVALNIETISAADPGRITLAEEYPLPQGVQVTINGISGSGDFATNLNANTFYLKSVPGNLQLYDLYTDDGLTTGKDTSTYGSYPTDTGIIIWNTVSSSADPGGTNGSIQFNSNDVGFGGDTKLTYDFLTNQLTLVGTGNISNVVTTSISTGANTTAGTITGNWSLTPGTRLTATYADLAEYYAGDAHYPAGTVLDFGGECEVTLAGIESNKIAGVVSADPAYVMNGMIKCDHPIAIALQGRVPCKVKGKVRKGDMMISAGDGFAKAAVTAPNMGTVIGKALANFDGEEGTIEVAVGRL